MKSTPSTHGFSLIEVTLALLVFALAIMAVLALFPTGAVANRDSQDFTYASQFARRVFDGALAEAMGNTGRWAQLADAASNGCINPVTVSLAPASSDFMWQNRTGFVCVVSTQQCTLVFRSDDDTNVMDHVLRYKLTAQLIELPRTVNGYETWWTDTNVIVDQNGVILGTNVTTTQNWWTTPEQFDNYTRRYREQTLRLVLEIWPGRYGGRNYQVYYCYVPRFM